MGYPALPLTELLQASLFGWSLYACVAILFVVAATVAVCEHRERRRLERALAVARQVKPLVKDWTPPPSPVGGRLRLWLFPLIAIVGALAVTVWSVWNVLAS